MILKPYPAPERPSLRLKMYAAGALVGKRAGWGHGRKWEGNYLVVVRSVCLSVCLSHTARCIHGSGVLDTFLHQDGRYAMLIFLVLCIVISYIMFVVRGRMSVFNNLFVQLCYCCFSLCYVEILLASKDK